MRGILPQRARASAARSDRSSARDARWLRRCLDLAARADGLTSPNPMVGAIVLKGGRVLAEAWHRRAGGPHAEVAALELAGRSARGAVLYVSLEPCNHFGRTPPCVDAILAAGVRRVVACHRDPFPVVNGRGFAALRRAGVQVRVGLLRREAERLNERYLTWVTRGRPFVLVKAAMTLDGRIATAGGHSRWISSEASRLLSHRMRAAHDAVMVGIETVLADDPLLTARGGPAGRRGGGPARQPLRVVLDSRLRISPRARLLAPGGGGPAGSVIIYTTERAPASRRQRLERRGAEVVQAASERRSPGGRVDVRAALRDLARRGVTSLMIEGGGELIWSALRDRVVDKVAFFVAPLIVGGRGAAPAVGGGGALSLRDGIALKDLTVRRVGRDLLVEGYVQGRAG